MGDDTDLEIFAGMFEDDEDYDEHEANVDYAHDEDPLWKPQKSE